MANAPLVTRRRRLAEATSLQTVAVVDGNGEPAPSDADTFAFWLQPAP